MVTNVKSPITPAEAMYVMDLKPTDIVLLTGLSISSVRRATLGSGKRINIETARLIADALQFPVDDITWPGPLTSAGRTPLTGGNYTVGAGSRTSDTSDVATTRYILRDDQAPVSYKKPEFAPKYCDHPDHNLVLPLSGICDLCVA